jgi:hypothetical protein
MSTRADAWRKSWCRRLQWRSSGTVRAANHGLHRNAGDCRVRCQSALSGRERQHRFHEIILGFRYAEHAAMDGVRAARGIASSRHRYLGSQDDTHSRKGTTRPAAWALRQ